MERILSKTEEQILRLHHHDFDGLGIKDTAVKMSMTVKEVRTHLEHINQLAPQMFPILTPRQRAILTLYDQHTSRKAIAEALSISLGLLGKEVTFLRQHGFLFNRTMKQYRPSMDGDVKQKF